MRVMIAAGGTGGHIYPGIAVAKEIRMRHPESKIRFVGTARGLETHLVPNAGFELSLIESSGLVNLGLRARLKALYFLPRSFIAARRLILEFNPDIVVGVGGYVSGPVVMTAVLRGRPTMIIEPNAVAGFTNRMLARFVTRAAVSFEATLKYFPERARQQKRVIVTGNPVRQEFFNIRPLTFGSEASEEFSILVFGGSQGARAINEAMVMALPLLENYRGKMRITHQTGRFDFEKVRSSYQNYGWLGRVDVREYIEDMVTEFAKADLVVSRAGATTSAELMAAGRPAIMVPLPGQLEQRRNAEVLQEKGAVRLILQENLSGEKLAEAIKSLLDLPERLIEMAMAARSMTRGNAAVAVVDIIESLISQSRQ